MWHVILSNVSQNPNGVGKPPASFVFSKASPYSDCFNSKNFIFLFWYQGTTKKAVRRLYWKFREKTLFVKFKKRSFRLYIVLHFETICSIPHLNSVPRRKLRKQKAASYHIKSLRQYPSHVKPCRWSRAPDTKPTVLVPPSQIVILPPRKGQLLPPFQTMPPFW